MSSLLKSSFLIIKTIYDCRNFRKYRNRRKHLEVTSDGVLEYFLLVFFSGYILMKLNLERTFVIFLSFLKDFIYLFLDRGEGREKERERNINVWLPLTRPLLGTWPTTHTCVLTGNRASNPLVCRPVLNPLIHTSQGLYNQFLELNSLDLKHLTQSAFCR